MHSKTGFQALLWASVFWQSHSHGAEPVVAVAALPPALGGCHPLHVVPLALRSPALCSVAACLALECSHIQPARKYDMGVHSK